MTTHGAKIYTQQSVYAAAIERLNKVFDDFEEVSVAFSGGKDSTVLLHLALEVAAARRRLPVRAMFIDLEGQYQSTIHHVTEMFNDPRVAGSWFCIPLNLRNAVSQHQPHWACWDPSERENWIRPMPQHPTVISDPSVFPFYHYRMEFEQFVPAHEKHIADAAGKRLAVLVGIRADESLNRFRTVKRTNVRRHAGLNWTSALQENVINCYPIYDWRVEDIWTYIATHNLPYNRLYDWMYLHGTTLHKMRICQPYGDDQRVGLDQFHAIEPDTWERILARVQGVNGGALYANQRFMGYRGGIGLPDGLTWKQYTKLLLKSLPPDVAAQYTEKFVTYMRWWLRHRDLRIKRGYARFFDSGIKDPAVNKNIPSWQRMALCILRNDYWCHSLKFGQTTRMHEKQQALKEKYKSL